MKVFELGDWAERTLMWDSNVPLYAPFKIHCHLEREIQSGNLFLSFPYKIVSTRSEIFQHIAVRTDAQPMMWLWWWLVIRLEESAKLSNHWLLYMLQIWGLAKFPVCDMPCWKVVLQQWKNVLTHLRKINFLESEKQP